MPWMSPSEYAKERGVSAQRITALKARLKPATRPKGKRYEIHSETADEILARTIDPSWSGQSKLKKPAAAKKKKSKTQDDSDPPPPPADQERQTSFNDAKRLKMLAEAGLKRLELEERSGRLVKAVEVETAAFNRARAVRDALLNIPDKISGVLAAESDPIKVAKLLDAEIRQALEELAT